MRTSMIPLIAIAAVGTGFSTGLTALPPAVSSAHCVTITRPLSYGIVGPDVLQLQQFLGVLPTGYFGPLTLAAITKWQLSSGVIASAISSGAGLVGPKTRAALLCHSSTSASTVQNNWSPAAPSASSTNSVATTTVISPPPQPLPSGGGGGSGGGGSGGGSVSECPAFTTPKPPASQCTTGTWEIIDDESGVCPSFWNCSDSNATE